MIDQGEVWQLTPEIAFVKKEDEEEGKKNIKTFDTKYKQFRYYSLRGII